MIQWVRDLTLFVPFLWFFMNVSTVSLFKYMLNSHESFVDNDLKQSSQCD